MWASLLVSESRSARGARTGRVRSENQKYLISIDNTNSVYGIGFSVFRIQCSKFGIALELYISGIEF